MEWCAWAGFHIYHTRGIKGFRNKLLAIVVDILFVLMALETLAVVFSPRATASIHDDALSMMVRISIFPLISAKWPTRSVCTILNFHDRGNILSSRIFAHFIVWQHDIHKFLISDLIFGHAYLPEINLIVELSLFWPMLCNRSYSLYLQHSGSTIHWELAGESIKVASVVLLSFSGISERFSNYGYCSCCILSYGKIISPISKLSSSSSVWTF